MSALTAVRQIGVSSYATPVSLRSETKVLPVMSRSIFTARQIRQIITYQNHQVRI